MPEGGGMEEAANDALARSGAIELHLGSGRHIVVRPGFDRRTLRDLLVTLEAES